MAYELYWFSGSPNIWRVALALEYKGIPYISHRMDPSKMEHKLPEFIAMNPHGKVPVLKDGDHVIYESVAILTYLDRKHPSPALFGTNAKETGLIWQRIFEVMNYSREVIEDGVVRPLFRGQAEQAGEAIKAASIQVHDALKWVESVLTEAPYLAGGGPTAADITYMPTVQTLVRAGRGDAAVQLDLGFEDFSESYPNIHAWLGRMETLPGYDEAFPPHWRTD